MYYTMFTPYYQEILYQFIYSVYNKKMLKKRPLELADVSA